MTVSRQYAAALLIALGAAVPRVAAQDLAPASDVRLSEAAALMRDGALGDAIGLLEDLVESRPQDIDAHLLLGSALAMVPRREEAIESVLRALELGPENAKGHASAGAVLARLGENDAARHALERAVELDPAQAGAHLSLAMIRAAGGEYEAATAHMARALELESDSGRISRLRLLNGKLFAELGKLEVAAREFERAVTLDPGSAEACLALGVTRKRLLLEDEAYPMLTRAVELAPEDPTARYQLALELLRRGDASGAASHLLRAHEGQPRNQAILYNLTRALFKAGRRDEAAGYRAKLASMIAASDRAREHELDTARRHAEAVRLDQAGRHAAAIDMYRSVLEYEPLNAVARRNLALALGRMGRWAEGIEELEAILRDDPDDAETARARGIMLDRARRDGASGL